MPQARRRKLALALLLLYWPAFFVVSHIPIPDLVRRAGLSDKTLHFLAYMILVFLLWSTTKPYDKINWRKPAGWVILVLVVWYGVFDELLQARVGRTADVRDFAADVVGTAAGLVIMSLLSFWPAFLAVSAITIFAMANLARSDVSELLPLTNAAFHLLAYGLFTAVWLKNLSFKLKPNLLRINWIVAAAAIPVCLLGATKTCSAILGKPIPPKDILMALTAIGLVVILYPLARITYGKIFVAGRRARHTEV